MVFRQPSNVALHEWFTKMENNCTARMLALRVHPDTHVPSNAPGLYQKITNGKGSLKFGHQTLLQPVGI